MAPEQARGERALDARVDVYALGALLFHCLTGRPPFESETLQGLLVSVMQRPAPRLGDRVPVPRALEDLVSRMLDKDPGRRPGDGEAVLRELSALGRGAELALSATAIAGPSGTGVPETASTVRSALSSVAVLPFHDMSAARDQGYLCEGIAEELINTLTALSGLRVTARSSSFVLRDSDLDARTIGQRLGVDAVLEGGVRKSGDRLRVTVQLVDVAGGSPRWSHRFDGSLEQVFEIQDQIAASVATALKGMLSTEEREALRRPEAQVEAYEHFLRGRQHLHAQTGTSFDIAEREFLRAIEINPGYAPAHAGLAQVYMWYVDWMGRGEPARQAADRASRRALELGPELAESHVARGAYLTSVCDYAGAEKEYREAIRLNPRSFDAHYLLARCGVHGGNHELAAEMFQRAAELRPEDFQCCAIAEVPLNRLGRLEEAARSRQEALRRINRHLELAPRDPRALILGAIVLVAEGRREQGFDWAARALAEGPEGPGDAHQRRVHVRARRAEGRGAEGPGTQLRPGLGEARLGEERSGLRLDPGRPPLPGAGGQAELSLQSSLGPSAFVSGPSTGAACSTAAAAEAAEEGWEKNSSAAAISSCTSNGLRSVRNTPGTWSTHCPWTVADIVSPPKSRRSVRFWSSSRNWTPSISGIWRSSTTSAGRASRSSIASASSPWRASATR